MHNLFMVSVAILSLIGEVAHADTNTNDRVFADVALRELHNLAVAIAQSERAAKESDEIGCRNEYETMQNAAHEAIANMHYMSFAPIDAIADVSSLLRVSHLTPNGCATEVVTDTNILLILAGQAVMALRV